MWGVVVEVSVGHDICNWLPIAVGIYQRQIGPERVRCIAGR